MKEREETERGGRGEKVKHRKVMDAYLVVVFMAQHLQS